MEPDEQPEPASASPEAHEAEEDSDPAASTDEEQQHGADGGKKKKKKKKKKKPAAGGGSSSSGEEAASALSAADNKQPATDKHEAERRFQKALESAKNSEDMWVLLGNANIHDAKARKLFEALRHNSSITSVNLSDNSVGEEGVAALVDVLQQGGCSELISLDLRGNPLSPEAEALLAELSKKRKQLAIATGPLPSAEPEPSSSGGGRQPGGRGGRRGGRGGAGAAGAGRGAAAGAAGDAAAAAAQEQVWNDQSLKELVRHSPMFRRYFQTGDEDDAEAGSSGDEEGEQADELPPPEEAWGPIEQLLPRGRESIPALSEALVTISRALDADMSAMPASEDQAQLADFKPHFRAVVERLPLLQQLLLLEPEPKLCQAGRGEPQPAVGSHRVWAAGILHMLLLHNSPVIDEAIAATELLPRALALALAHERCSALQCRAVEMLRCSLQSSVPQLWRGLFQPGWGCDLQQQPGGEPMPPLHEAVVQLAAAAVQQPMGSRSCVVGFATELANTLLQAAGSSGSAEPPSRCVELAELLASCAEWRDSIAPGGPIAGLLQEQDGHLCGPPPPRPAPSVGSLEEEGSDPSLGIINGQLMALLSRMGELS